MFSNLQSGRFFEFFYFSMIFVLAHPAAISFLYRVAITWSTRDMAILSPQVDFSMLQLHLLRLYITTSLADTMDAFSTFLHFWNFMGTWFTVQYCSSSHAICYYTSCFLLPHALDASYAIGGDINWTLSCSVLYFTSFVSVPSFLVPNRSGHIVVHYASNVFAPNVALLRISAC